MLNFCFLWVVCSSSSLLLFAFFSSCEFENWLYKNREQSYLSIYQSIYLSLCIFINVSNPLCMYVCYCFSLCLFIYNVIEGSRVVSILKGESQKLNIFYSIVRRNHLRNSLQNKCFFFIIIFGLNGNYYSLWFIL